MKEFIWDVPYVRTKVAKVTVLQQPSSEEMRRVTEGVRNIERLKEFNRKWCSQYNVNIERIEPIKQNDAFHANEIRMNKMVKP